MSALCPDCGAVTQYQVDGETMIIAPPCRCRYSRAEAVSAAVRLKPGPGAWTREVVWDQVSPREWTADLASDGACIRYTLRATPIPPRDEYALSAARMTVEAHEQGAQHHGPYHVVEVAEWRVLTPVGDDDDDITERAADAIRACHHWVGLVLRVAGGES